MVVGNISVSAPFVWRCLSGRDATPRRGERTARSPARHDGSDTRRTANPARARTSPPPATGQRHDPHPAPAPGRAPTAGRARPDMRATGAATRQRHTGQPRARRAAERRARAATRAHGTSQTQRPPIADRAAGPSGDAFGGIL